MNSKWFFWVINGIINPNKEVNTEEFRISYISNDITAFYMQKSLPFTLFTPPTYVSIDSISVTDKNIKAMADFEFIVKT